MPLRVMHKPRSHKKRQHYITAVKVATLGGENSEKNGYVVCVWPLTNYNKQWQRGLCMAPYKLQQTMATLGISPLSDLSRLFINYFGVVRVVHFSFQVQHCLIGKVFNNYCFGNLKMYFYYIQFIRKNCEKKSFVFSKTYVP